jgi:NADP-dependent 3-hydroxy acid dehydrogenase YdfG
LFNIDLSISSTSHLNLEFDNQVARIYHYERMAPKTVLITGCSKGGIGDALAQEFHRKGVHVFATARSLSKISHLKDMGITTFELDVTSPDSIRNGVSFVEKETEGRLDFLVNNAGMGTYLISLLSDFRRSIKHADRLI